MTTMSNARKKPIPTTGPLNLTPVAKLDDAVVKTLDWIERVWRQDHLRRLPSPKQLSIGLGLPRSTAWDHVDALRRAGCIDQYDDLTTLAINTVVAWRKSAAPPG